MVENTSKTRVFIPSKLRVKTGVFRVINSVNKLKSRFQNVCPKYFIYSPSIEYNRILLSNVSVLRTIKRNTPNCHVIYTCCAAWEILANKWDQNRLYWKVGIVRQKWCKLYLMHWWQKLRKNFIEGADFFCHSKFPTNRRGGALMLATKNAIRLDSNFNP